MTLGRQVVHYSLILAIQGCVAIAPSLAQNLVLNPSFEEYFSCPASVGQIDSCLHWSQPNTVSSSTDYFHSCAGSGPIIPGVPTNFMGHQYAHTGHGYAGWGMGGADTSFNAWEYLQGTFREPLDSGVTYCARFFVCLANESRYAIDQIGANFSTSPHSTSSFWEPLSVQPHVSNPKDHVLSDTLNWVPVEGSFVARGGEKYITIGNFHSAAQTTFDTVSGQWYAYYYVDDVSVWPCELAIEPPDVEPSVHTDQSYLHLPNAFSPNGDGINDEFSVIGEFVSDFHLQVFNRWGQLVFESMDIGQGWDGTFMGEQQPMGVYSVVARGVGLDGAPIIKTGSVTLMR